MGSTNSTVKSFVMALVTCGIGVSRLPAAEPPDAQPASRTSGGKDALPDKSGYTLFNPVPRSMLRDLGTDRPDQTEGPYTVDAGHIQVESDLVSYIYDRKTPGPAKTTSQSITPLDFNVRVGLLNNLEADIIAFPYVWQREVDRDTRAADERDGFGDTLIRVKMNFFGNDHAEDQPVNLALGLMPYIKFPTNTGHLSNHYVEGGVIFPIDLALPDTWSIGAMTEIDAIHNFDGAGYHAQWVNTIVVHRDILRDVLGGYVEYYDGRSAGKHIGPVASVDGGLLWSITKDVQLDVGINVGVTKRAPDYNPFLGLSVRF